MRDEHDSRAYDQRAATAHQYETRKRKQQSLGSTDPGWQHLRHQSPNTDCYAESDKEQGSHKEKKKREAGQSVQWTPADHRARDENHNASER